MQWLFVLLLSLLDGFAAAKPFHVLYQPNDRKFDRLDHRIMTATSWYWFKWDANSGYDYSKVDLDVVKRTAKEWPASTIMAIDIENFPNTPEGNAQLELAITTLKQANPTIRVGFYGEWPRQDYWARVPYNQDLVSIQKGIEPTKARVNEAKFKSSQIDSDRRFYLTKYADIIFPSCYTFYRTATIADVTKDPEVENWRLYCRSQIQEAKKANKDIYVFLWPVYHSSATNNVKYVEGAYWRKELDTVFADADGIVIWHGFYDDPNFYTQDWVQVTHGFLNEKSLYLP